MPSSHSEIQIFTAATMHTLTDRPVQAFATLGEWIVATGTVSELRSSFPAAEMHDFGARVIIPGFNDAHQHPTMMAEQLLDVDLSPDSVSSTHEILTRLRERAGVTSPGQWVLGSRYDHSKSTGGHILTRDELDSVCPEHPVLVRQIGMHWGVLNSAGLHAAGIVDDSEAPVGGKFGRDGAGRLTGAVYERAFFELLDAVVPPHGLDAQLRALDRYQEMMHAAGITSVGDALVSPGGLRVLQEAHARRGLSLRVNMLLAYTVLDQLEAIGLRTGLGDRWLRVGGIKTFVDGAIAGGTCLLEEPYEDGCAHGIQAIPDDELVEFVRRVHDAGSTACVHANGDRAIRLLLDAVESAQLAKPRPDVRHRIEHCSVVTNELLRRAKKLGMVAVPFGSYVAFHGEKLPSYYGMDRLTRMFPHRDLIDAGIAVAGSSDFPCGPYSVLLALRSCVTRQAADGTILGENQQISPTEALALYTTGSAYATGEEHIKGKLTEGMLADFVVLDRDLLKTPGENLTDIEIEQTWVGSRRVWSAAGS
jgi:predicted amidohydrolase YtcJ